MEKDNMSRAGGTFFVANIVFAVTATVQPALKSLLRNDSWAEASVSSYLMQPRVHLHAFKLPISTLQLVRQSGLNGRIANSCCRWLSGFNCEHRQPCRLLAPSFMKSDAGATTASFLCDFFPHFWMVCVCLLWRNGELSYADCWDKLWHYPQTLIRNKRPLKKDGWMIEIHLFRAASDHGYGARLNNFTIDDCVHRCPCEQQAVLWFQGLSCAWMSALMDCCALLCQRYSQAARIFFFIFIF